MLSLKYDTYSFDNGSTQQTREVMIIDERPELAAGTKENMAVHHY